jgi:hypothetical protein
VAEVTVSYPQARPGKVSGMFRKLMRARLAARTPLQRLDVRNQLPALGVRQFPEARHAVYTRAVGDDPVQFAGRRILNLLGAQRRMTALAFGIRSVALGTFLRVSLSARGRSTSIVRERVRCRTVCLRHFLLPVAGEHGRA